jgi:hypothetical protein
VVYLEAKASKNPTTFAIPMSSLKKSSAAVEKFREPWI